jgi:adenine-specific DNA-methyltransferase
VFADEPSGRRGLTHRTYDYSITYAGKKSVDQILAAAKRPPSFRSWISDGNRECSNRFYLAENLGVLGALIADPVVSGKVRLVYIDPPYGTEQAFRGRYSTHAYDDRLAGAAYLEVIRERLILIRELLADDGSIYVHLDNAMAAPIKVILDEVFGPGNFRNWITRKKSNSKNFTRRQYGNMQDYILFYSKGRAPVWNRPLEDGRIYTFEQRFPKVESSTGRRYALVPIHAKGRRNGRSGVPWRGLMPPEGKHWQFSVDKLDELESAGRIYWSPTGNPRRKIYADESSSGIVVQDIWLGFKDAHNQNIKVTGYPTEKNLDLLKRIVSASSNPGDLVLDCFSGSGTTLVAAAELGRRWIGVDNSQLACLATLQRLLESRSINGSGIQDKLPLGDFGEESGFRVYVQQPFELGGVVSPAPSIHLTARRNGTEVAVHQKAVKKIPVGLLLLSVGRGSSEFSIDAVCLPAGATQVKTILPLRAKVGTVLRCLLFDTDGMAWEEQSKVRAGA